MPKSRRSYLSQDERRAQLLAFGLELFSEKSYDDVSTDDIAHHAGVSKGLMYHYFGNKRGFYTEVVRYSATQMLDVLQPDPEQSPISNLRRGLVEYFDFVVRHGGAYLALMTGGIGFDESINQIVEDARKAVVERILEHSDVPTASGLYRVATRSWLGGVEAAAQDMLCHGDVPLNAVIEMLMASLLVQLRAAMASDEDRPTEIDEEAQALLMKVLTFGATS